VLKKTPRIFFPKKTSFPSGTSLNGEFEYRIPYQRKLYEGFGLATDPTINFPVKTIRGYSMMPFLMDSGAIISTLPLSTAIDLGVDLKNSKRLTIQGIAEEPDFGYTGKFAIKINNKDYEVPAVFTEFESGKYILGRLGFFDDFSILFDHVKKEIVISRKDNG
jgi:hypothetical protein